MEISQKTFKIIITITIVSVFLILLFYSLPNAPTLDTDAIFSVEAAKSIIETGVPLRISTNEFYNRDYLAHYLVAGSIFLSGDNSFGYAFPSLIFSVLVLILTAIVARKITSNKLVIFLSIFFVAISMIENTYSVNPRSYMYFQFFYLLTIFLFYKGFVENNTKNKILTVFSYMASALSHYGGLILMPIFGFYTLIKIKKWYKDKFILIFFLVITIFSLILTFNSSSPISNALTSPNKNQGGPLDISFSSFLNGNISGYFSILFFYLPFISIFIFFGTFHAIKNKKQKLFYFYFIFWGSFLLISLSTGYINPKYVFCLLPLLVILSLDGTNKFINYFFLKGTNEKERKRLTVFIWTILILSSLITSHIIYNSYSFKSIFGDHKKIIFHLKENKQADDIIICTDPTIYFFYLNQCDYYLFQDQKMGGDKKTTWKNLPKNYKAPYNTGYIDNLEKLKKILSKNKTWIVTDKQHYSNEIFNYIRNNTELKYEKLNKHDRTIRLFLSNEK